MCNFFSGVITRFGEVYSLGDKTVKHEDIVEDYGLKDRNDFFARWEIIPIEKGDYLSKPSMDFWMFKVDEKELPAWWELEFESKCWRYFKSWMLSDAGKAFIEKVKQMPVEERLKLYTNGGPGGPTPGRVRV